MDINENIINNNLQQLQSNLDKSLTIINEYYSWLINSYVLVSVCQNHFATSVFEIFRLNLQDFYVENHWSDRLPLSWKTTLSNKCPEDLCELFSIENETITHIWPLSILSLRALIKTLTINRNNSSSTISSNDLSPLASSRLPCCYTHPKLKQIFSKHIKPKKKHEIQRMSQVCVSTAQECGNVQYIVDVGGGLGHLSRKLAFGYGLNVCCLEQQSKLSCEAKEIDQNLLYVAAKYLSDMEMKMLGKLSHLI